MSADEHLSEGQFGYRMAHRPGVEDDPGLHHAEHVYPDIHQHPEYYTSGLQGVARRSTPEGAYARQAVRADGESLAAIKSARDKPDAPVMMHRAVPSGVSDIHTGDWVTTSHTYAQQHVESNLEGKGHVLSAPVPAHHLRATGDSIHEYGYAGPSIRARP